MVMGKKTGDATPVQVDEDIWTQCATHGPGNKKTPLSLVNRSIIYRLRPEGGPPFLVVLNALWVCDASGEPINGIKELSKQLGAEVKFVVTPGGGHHLSLAQYAKAFPGARVCVPEGRIVTQNPELIAMPNVETYAASTVPPELAAAGLDIVLWTGLVEGPLNKKFQRLAGTKNYSLQSIEPQVFLHRPSGTITNGGHHMWFTPADGPPVVKAPGLLKFVIKLMTGTSFNYQKPGKLSSDPHGVYHVRSREDFQAGAQAVLAWEFDKMIDIHAGLDSQLASGARAIIEEALRPIADGAWDQVPFPDASPSWPN